MVGIMWQESIRMALGAESCPWPTAAKEMRSLVISLRGMSFASLEKNAVLEKEAHSS